MHAGNYIKIGATSSLKKRIAQVQTGCPLAIHKVDFIVANSKHLAFNMEKALHIKLADYNTFGEWFHIKVVNLTAYIDVFKDSRSQVFGINQKDKSISHMEKFYMTISQVHVDKRYEKLSILLKSVENTYEYSFIHIPKTLMIKKIVKELFKYSARNTSLFSPDSKKVNTVMKKYAFIGQRELDKDIK